MIKCPKCSFDQPEDIYCANCGVNMKTFQALPKPLAQQILSSWMTKVALLTAVIIAVVMYDRQKEPKNATPQTLAQRSAIPREAAPMAQPQAATESATAASSAKGTAPAPGSLRPLSQKTAPAFEPQRPLENNPTQDKTAAGAPVAKPSMRVNFYQASRASIQELQRDSQNISTSGEVSGGITSAAKLQRLISSGELKNLSGNRYRDFDSQHPVVIFKGQRSAEASKNIGLYFQLTPLRLENGTAQMEIKSWGDLKFQGDDENLFSSEMTLNSQSAAFITGFLPKDKNFTDEEKAIFEAERTLKIYNQEDFWDGSSDLIMVVELTQGP